MHSTCLNRERKRGAPCDAKQTIQVNRVCGARLQTFKKTKSVKWDSILRLESFNLLFSRKVRHTRESVGGQISWQGPADGRMQATRRPGFDKETCDALPFIAPCECERVILHIWDTHTARSTDICVEKKRTKWMTDQGIIGDGRKWVFGAVGYLPV